MTSLFSKLADSPTNGAYYAPGTSGYAAPTSQGWGGSTTFAGFVGNIIGVIDAIIPLLLMVAVAIFFWGLADYIYRAGDTHANAKGKDLIRWGLVAFFVLLSLWGILDLAKTSLLPHA